VPSPKCSRKARSLHALLLHSQNSSPSLVHLFASPIRDHFWASRCLHQHRRSTKTGLRASAVSASAHKTPPSLPNLTHIARHGDPSPSSHRTRHAASRTSAALPKPHRPPRRPQRARHTSTARTLSWAQDLAKQLLGPKKPAPAWTSTGNAKWSLQPRKLADGEVTVLQSMAKGGGDEESRTGTLRSKTFDAPAKLTLWINGHRGFPTAQTTRQKPRPHRRGRNGRELARAFPPRHNDCRAPNSISPSTPANASASKSSTATTAKPTPGSASPASSLPWSA
jgi:hypothetical protein